MSDIWIAILCILGYIVMGQITIVGWYMLYSGHDDWFDFNSWLEIIFTTLCWPIFFVMGLLALSIRGVVFVSHAIYARHQQRPLALKKILDFYPYLIRKLPHRERTGVKW